MTGPTVCLWFADQGEQAATRYVELLGGSITNVVRHGEGGQMPAGTAMYVSFELRGRAFSAINGGPHYQLTPATSLMVECATQAEIDRLWDALLADGGQALQCGWLTDRFGVTWQILPADLPRWMSDPAAAARVSAAFMPMQKLDIAVLEAAYRGG